MELACVTESLSNPSTFIMQNFPWFLGCFTLKLLFFCVRRAISVIVINIHHSSLYLLASLCCLDLCPVELAVVHSQVVDKPFCLTITSSVFAMSSLYILYIASFSGSGWSSLENQLYNSIALVELGQGTVLQTVPDHSKQNLDHLKQGADTL